MVELFRLLSGKSAEFMPEPDSSMRPALVRLPSKDESVIVYKSQ